MRLAWIVILGACGSHPPLHRVVFEGELVDVVSRVPHAGATVVVPRATGNSDIALADERGHFRVVADAGRHKLSIFDDDETFDVDVDVSEQPAQLTIKRPIVAALVKQMLQPQACSGAHQPVAPADLDDIGRLALARVPTPARCTVVDGADHRDRTRGRSGSVLSSAPKPVFSSRSNSFICERYYLSVRIDVAARRCATVTSSVRIRAAPRRRFVLWLLHDELTSTSDALAHGGLPKTGSAHPVVEGE